MTITVLDDPEMRCPNCQHQGMEWVYEDDWNQDDWDDHFKCPECGEECDEWGEPLW